MLQIRWFQSGAGSQKISYISGDMTAHPPMRREMRVWLKLAGGSGRLWAVGLNAIWSRIRREALADEDEEGRSPTAAAFGQLDQQADQAATLRGLHDPHTEMEQRHGRPARGRSSGAPAVLAQAPTPQGVGHGRSLRRRLGTLEGWGDDDSAGQFAGGRPRDGARGTVSEARTAKERSPRLAIQRRGAGEGSLKDQHEN